MQEKHSRQYNRGFYTAYENAQMLDGFGFFFDESDLSATDKEVIKTITTFSASMDDVDVYLEEFNQKFYDAGLGEVLDEANRQPEAHN